MYPAYTWTDSYPRHADVGAKEMIPSHTPPYQPWPYAPNYSYPVPHEYHGCCNHTCYGGGPYTFRPHYPHYPPPPPPPPAAFHPHGLYPLFPGAYPAYHVPPQHYSIEQPRYDYEKSNHHCCGCNHREDEKTPRIKDDLQVEKKADDSSLVPLLLKDQPNYPIMWIPRGYIGNTESEAKEKEKHAHNPVSVKHIEPSKQYENGEMTQDNKGPFQIFWLPAKNDEVREETVEDSKRLPDEKTLKNDERAGSEGECETNKKHVVQKVIPVKQVSTKEENKNPKSIETKVNTDNAEKKDDVSRGSPKASKLPPVCLRVDPLPRKKKSSRSPSPTSEKRRSNESPIDTPKSSQQVLKKSNEEEGEVNIKTVDRANKVERDNLADSVTTGKGDESEKEKNVKKKNLSEDEAALIIQSVYRGFEVRKSQPLKKLRQIHEVKKQVLELRNRIQDLETSNLIDGKKQVIIGETIMSLLLKLDTIQGLHPFVREVRKSVAKELVGLQERLDSLVKSEAPSDQQIMHPEHDGIQKSDQAQDHMSLSKNHETKYDDVAEACNNFNVEQPLEMSTEDDQAPTESDTVICENQEVEAAGCNTIGEPQVDSHKEEPTKCDDEALRLCEENQEVEATESHKLIQMESHKEKPTECDEALELCENHEVVVTESQEGRNTIDELESYEEKLDQAPTDCDEACETHKVEAIVSQEGGDTIGEPQVEFDKDEPPTECDEVEGRESQEGCSIGELQLESHKEKLNQAASECDEAYETPEVKGNGEAHKERFDEAPTECNEALGSCENEEVEATDNGDKLQMSDISMKSDEKANEGGAMDENEKVRMAMNEQLSVIRELTARVKDLEKKLSKSKKKKKNKGRRSRDCVVEKDF